VKVSAQIPENRRFTALISLAYHVPIEYEMIEDAPHRGVQPVAEINFPFAQCLRNTSRIECGANDVQVTSENNLLACSDQVSYPDIECLEEANAKVVTSLIAVCGTVNSKEHEARELENNATTFRVKCCLIDNSVELARSRIATNLLVFREVSVSGCGLWRCQDASDTFFSSYWGALRTSSVDGDARVT
jgi:hypothetical protein